MKNMTDLYGVRGHFEDLEIAGADIVLSPEKVAFAWSVNGSLVTSKVETFWLQKRGIIA